MTDLLPLELTPAQARALLADPRHPALLLDCRDPEEHALSRIAGSMLIPMGDIPARLPELEAHADRTIVVHCHHGVRSLRVTTYLRQQGFDRVTSMKGGIERWSIEIDPSVPRY